MITYTKTELRRAAMHRQGDYFAACLKAGRVYNDNVVFDRAALDKVRANHPHHHHLTPAAQQRRLRNKRVLDYPLGEAVHKIALPIAKFLKLKCVDPATGKLRPLSGCAMRRKKWAQITLRKILQKITL